MKPCWSGIAGWACLLVAFVLALVHPVVVLDGLALVVFGLAVAGVVLIDRGTTEVGRHRG